MARIFSLKRSRTLLVLAFTLLFVGVLGGAVGTAGATATDCDDNAIIKCGTGSASQFIQKVRANDSLNGHHDLIGIYAHYGLESADYDRFVSSARPGVAYKDGHIVVDGQTVVTKAMSIGRVASVHGSDHFTTSLPGIGTYYGNFTQSTFAAASIPVMVLFNNKGEVQFAVITSCGNPIYGTNTIPTSSCTKLHQQPVTGKPGTYSFTTDASATNGAKIVKLVYDFGDKSPLQTVTSTSAPVEHTYSVSGTYTAKVTVYVSLPGNQTITIINTNCATTVTVSLPFYECTALAATTIENSKYKYKFTVTAKLQNGATITSADFNFGDGTSQNIVAGAGASTVDAVNVYAKDGSYKAQAVLHISLPGGKTDTVGGANCARTVPVAVPYYDCVQLGGAILDASKYSYSFTATADYGNGSTFKSVDFDFGDKTVTKGVQPTGTAATVQHTYASAGNYRITATLHFSTGNTVHDVDCTATVTPTQPPTPECRPGVPQGSALCAQCKYDSAIPASDTTKCVPPATTTLPNTGAGSFVALFGAAMVAGFFIFRQYTFRQHATAAVQATDYPVGTAAEWPAVIDPQPVHHEQTTPNVLHHPTYHHPHRFRPRSHRHSAR